MTLLVTVIFVGAFALAFTACPNNDDNGGGGGNGGNGGGSSKPPTTWAAVTDSKFGTTTNIFGITYGNGKFIAVGFTGKIAYFNIVE